MMSGNPPLAKFVKVPEYNWVMPVTPSQMVIQRTHPAKFKLASKLVVERNVSESRFVRSAPISELLKHKYHKTIQEIETNPMRHVPGSESQGF